MTPDELARVPEGGFTYVYDELSENFPWDILKPLDIGSEFICATETESLARQIVGSVNAAIILNQMCSNWTNINWDDEKLSSPEVKFWLDYAKGSA